MQPYGARDSSELLPESSSHVECGLGAKSTWDGISAPPLSAWCLACYITLELQFLHIFLKVGIMPSMDAVRIQLENVLKMFAHRKYSANGGCNLKNCSG